MNIEVPINDYIASLPEPKRSDITILHQRIRQALPQEKIWFFDGKNEQGKIVANPTIGYGRQTLTYADGKTKEFYQIGISANTTGVSIYVIGLADKHYLPNTYGKTIGKASVTAYCIKFKNLNDIQLDILDILIQDALKQTTN